jgi:GT2 family glycosyltransferase
VIVNHNEKSLTLECVKSFRRLRYPNCELVVVDNASNDDSVEVFRRELPEATVLQAGANRGYCGGNNVGIRYALEKGSAYVHLLNPDTLLADGDYLLNLVQFMESNRDVGIIGPKVFWHSRDAVQPTTLVFPDLWRGVQRAVGGRWGQAQANLTSGPVQVEAINGVCVLIRAEVFRRVGLLDEKIFMYGDEVELGWRARNGGWMSVHMPVGSVIHLHRPRTDSAGFSGFLPRRNKVYCLLKMGRPLQAWLCAVISLVTLGWKCIIEVLHSPKKTAYFELWWRLFLAYLALLIRGRMTNPYLSTRVAAPSDRSAPGAMSTGCQAVGRDSPREPEIH